MRSYWLRISALVGIPLVATALWTLETSRGPGDVRVTYSPVTAGPIVRRIVVSGTLQPVTTVEVGTQVSGTVASITVDYNSIVHAGEVLLRLDAASYEAALDQARASLAEANADVTNARAAAEDARSKLDRAERLAAGQLIPLTDLDAARTAMAQANADVGSAQAKGGAAQAEVRRARVNLQQTIIRSPVDGVVVARNVDVGVTVAAVQSAPVLFRIATDFRQMQVLADVDESDIAAVRSGAPADFTVDAYPNQACEGRVSQVRLDAVREQPGATTALPPTTTQPATQPNVPSASVGAGPAVVSYPVIINVDNPDEKLRPGMTAVVTIDGARRDAVTRIPNAALTFTPSLKVLESARQTAPPPPESIKDDIEPTARVWEFDGTEFTPIPVGIGLADDEWTELVSGPIRPGIALVTNATVGGVADH